MFAIVSTGEHMASVVAGAALLVLGLTNCRLDSLAED